MRTALLWLLLVFCAPLATATWAADRYPEVKIIKDDLFERGNFYFVKGVVYNPNSRAVKNVVIKYYIWKK